MPIEARNEAGASGLAARGWRLAPFVLLLGLALPDLLSPPISPTLLRQTQTYAQTVNFVAAGFSPTGLTIDINGTVPFRVVYEFPLYQGIVGVLFLVFGPAYFWGKLVSLLAMLGAVGVFQRLVRARWGEAVALRAGLIVAACPITLLLATGFQPDALALLLALLALHALQRWRDRTTFANWGYFLAALLGAVLAKFTLLVPLVPVLAAGLMRPRPGWREIAVGVIGGALPFVAWLVYRGQLMDPAYLATDVRDFLLGDPGRFLRPAYYVKPAFILGGMVGCGIGGWWLIAGLRGARRLEWLLLAGVGLYLVLIPTASEQTYYALAVVPALALLMARGLIRLEAAAPSRRMALAAAWLAGLAVIGPYTLRHDRVTLEAALAAREFTAPGDLVFVLNMHDRGVGIGAFNPAIVTLAGRRGWNVDFASDDPAAIQAQIEARRRQGARWVVATWWSPPLDPWFTPLLPTVFSRCPKFADRTVNGAAIVAALEKSYPVGVRGENFALLRLPPQ